MGKVVLTTGVFDCGMHIGHFMLLKHCVNLAGDDGKVIVGVNSDYSAEQYKRKPIFDDQERICYLNQLGFIDEVIRVNSEDDIEQIIKESSVDYYVKGAEWLGKKITGEDLCTVVFFQPTRGYYGNKISTTDIIESIKKYEHNRTHQTDNQ